MIIKNTEIKDLYVIEPSVFNDARGWFIESYNKKILESNGIFYDFLQDNHSYSQEKGTIRGLHLQLPPKSQTKLIRCTKGEIFDVAVDLRKGSNTYKKWVGVILSEKNKHQLLIPKGFAHGFLTLTEEVEVQYKVDEYYSKDNDISIRWDDPEIDILWPIKESPILSQKDKFAKFLNQLESTIR